MRDSVQLFTQKRSVLGNQARQKILSQPMALTINYYSQVYHFITDYHKYVTANVADKERHKASTTMMARGRRNLDENAAPYESPNRGTIENLMALKKQKGAVHRPIIFVEKERSPLLKKSWP